MKRNNIKLLYIDLFCGAGGTSTGVHLAKYNDSECAKVIACVNHDKNAIASHNANHPDALHFTEDIRTLELSPIVEHIQREKVLNSEALIVLWASLECTNFSKAKGGQSRDADSRTLAEHLFRYIEEINPDYIQIENVQEFMSWGEMDENGKPISMDKGKSYEKWVSNVKAHGYKFDYRIMNSADFGAYTSRKRFFGIFAKDDLPIVFPEQTHSKKAESSLFSELKQWKPVKDVLDFSDEGVSIFGRSKDLSEKTLERIYAGLIKFVAGGKDKWILKYNSINGKTGKNIPPSIEAPCPTISCQGRLGVVSVDFLSRYNSVEPQYTALSLNEPCGVLTTHNKFAKVSAEFLTKYFTGNPDNMVQDIDVPCGTVTTKDRFSLVTSHYLMNPQFKSAGGSIDNPCFTLIARMDKMPPYLVATETGEIGIEVYQSDSPMTIKVKEVMALYGIMDIKMRMLKIPELKRIMGFPEDYTLIGTQAEQKKYIGNAVEVTMAKVLCEALCQRLNELNVKPINKAA